MMMEAGRRSLSSQEKSGRSWPFQVIKNRLKHLPGIFRAQPEGAEWRLLGASVVGALHKRQGRPNQDAIAWRSGAKSGLPAILAVSDGHGDSRSFRSEIGARLAVETTINTLQAFFERQKEEEALTTIQKAAESRLPKELVRAWREVVSEHLSNTRFSLIELKRLEDEMGPSARLEVEKNSYLAYGATLLAVSVHALRMRHKTNIFSILLQLGDGDLLSVSDKGEVELPLPQDPRLFANETTSLSSASCWEDFRTGFQVYPESPPALFMLCTDGYSNSFGSDADFKQIGPDILSILRRYGPDQVEASLDDWLEETSQGGSGDDITLGIICRTSSLLSGR